MLQAIDAYRDQIEDDPDDLGTSFNAETGYQPTLDDLLKRWRADPIGTRLQHGIKETGRIIAPHVTLGELVGIAEEASSRSADYGVSIGILEHMWNGLKTTDGHRWAA